MADGGTQLVISIDIADARKQLDDLHKEFQTKVGEGIPQEAKKADDAVKQLQTAMDTVKGVDPAATDSVAKLGAQMEALKPQAGIFASIGQGATEAFASLGVAMNTLLPLFAGLGNGLKQAALLAGALTFNGIIAGASALGSAIASVTARIVSMLTRLAAFAVIAAVLTPIIMAFKDASDKAKALSEAIGSIDMKKLSPDLQKANEDLTHMAEKLHISKDKVKDLSQGFIQGALGIDQYGISLEREIAREEKLRDQTTDALAQRMRVLDGYKQLAKEQGGLTAAQKAGYDETQRQIAGLAEFLNANTKLIGSNKNYLATQEEAIAAWRRTGQSMGEAQKKTEELAGSTQGLKALMDSAPPTGLFEGMSRVLKTAGDELFATKEKWKGYGDAAAQAGNQVKASSDNLFAEFDRMSRQDELLKKASQSLRDYVTEKRAEADASRANVAQVKASMEANYAESKALGDKKSALLEANKAAREQFEMEKGSAGTTSMVLSNMRAVIDTTEREIKAIEEKMDVYAANYTALARLGGAEENNIKFLEKNIDSNVRGAAATKQAGDAAGEAAKKTDAQREAATSAITKFQALVAPMEAVNKTTQDTTKAMDGAAKSWNTFATVSDKASTSFNTIALDVRTFGDALHKLPQDLNNANGAMPGFVENVDKLAVSMVTLPDQLVKTADSFTAMATALPVVAQQLAPVSAGFELLAQKAESFDKIGASVKLLAEDLSTFATNAGTAEEAVTKLATSTGTFTTNTNAAKEATTGQTDAMKTAEEEAYKLADAYLKAADAARQLAQAQGGTNNSGGGGGNTTTQQQKSGGMIGQSIDSPVTRATKEWDHAPRLAAGTPNTSIFAMNGMGEIPIMAHPNEAVVPLSNSRSIPVDINLTKLGLGELMTPSVVIMHRLDKTLSKLETGLATYPGNAVGPPPPKLVDGPAQRALHGSDRRRAHPLRSLTDMTGDPIDGGASGMGSDGPIGQAQAPRVTQPTIIVNMHSGRFDNFKMTQDQLAAAARKAIEKTARQNT